MKKSFKAVVTKMLCTATVLSALFATNVFAAEATDKIISVSGSASISATPDLANISIGADIVADTSGAASEQLATISAAIDAALKSEGVADKDITSSGFNISPWYNYETGMMDESQYEGYIRFRVNIRDFSKIGSIIEKCIDAGANDIGYLSFYVSEQSVYYDELYKAIYTDAKDKASAIASAMGVNLGSPVFVGNNFDYYPSHYYSASEKLVAYNDADGALKTLDMSSLVPEEVELDGSLTVHFTFR